LGVNDLVYWEWCNEIAGHVMCWEFGMLILWIDYSEVEYEVWCVVCCEFVFKYECYVCCDFLEGVAKLNLLCDYIL